ncbi:MAG: hypothetical protein EOP86_20545 [Verrucomicrobiaceae bacterium]|nr:MAG: hypothetical protein EOP86_20545 [Verrucomicrobiaceae bacterium]
MLDRVELDFSFDRPARFVDMEGGETLLADPPMIASRYQEAVKKYLAEMDEMVRTTGVDYQRVLMSEPFGEVLARFLLSRLQSKGRR